MKNSEKWQEVSALFQIALDCEPDKRADLLAEKCDGDDELRREVEELLNLHHDDENDNFLSDGAAELSAKLLTDDFSPSLEGRQIGVYKIQRELGKGGMGVVCLAVRDDEFRKRVALKLVKRGMDTDEILNRFRHERQILASLDHPNIARLLDGGTTDDGLPFFVMEYVEGEAIDKYCESQKLSLEEDRKSVV